MVKASLFLIILLTYLGLSKSYSLSTKNYPVLKGEEYFATALSFNAEEKLISLILKKQYQTGVFFKSFIQEYLFIKSYKEAKVITVQVPYPFFVKSAPHIGKSIYRISAYQQISTTVQEAGINFIGNPALGRWVGTSNGRQWHFFNAYSDFYKQNIPRSPLYNYKNYVKALHNESIGVPAAKGKIEELKKTPHSESTKQMVKEFFKNQFRFNLFHHKVKDNI